jgi:hypothetical protein
MQKIIDKTEKIAIEYLTGMGFGEEQVVPLINQAKKDLETEFARLESIQNSPSPEAEALDRSLHALKGLLFNLGNHDLAKKLEAIRAEHDVTRMLSDLDRVLEEAAR